MTIIDIFQPFLSAATKFDVVCIDNNVFRLHYKATVVILAICSVLVMSNQFIGDPIDCLVDGVPSGLMDSYCWIHATFSIPSRWVGRQGSDLVAPGVAPISGQGEDAVYHKYYQWVCYVLVLQAGLFYLPRLVWRQQEGGRLAMLVNEMREPKLVVQKEQRAERISTIVRYFRDNRGQHAAYAAQFFICEILNFVNVIGQMFLMDKFLGYEFSTYGLQVLSYTEMDAADRPDALAVVFPKVSKCTFSKYGPSGTVERHDGLCVLPLNIINEKIYIFLWFWFILLASITGLFMAYRCAVLLAAGIRTAMIQARAGRVSRDKIADIISEPGLSYSQQVGDFFLLYLVAKNLDEVATKELILELHSTLKPAYSNAPTLKASSKNNSAVGE